MAAGLEMRITGVADLRRVLRRLGDRAPKALGRALYEEGEEIMTRSKEEFVPIDLSTLKNSGFVAEPRSDGGGVVVELGYGGAAAAYAVVQHERLDFYHPDGQAKYLERPALDAVSGMGQRLANRLRSELGGV